MSGGCSVSRDSGLTVARTKGLSSVCAAQGITTNPTILERDGVKCNTDSLRELARDAFDCGAQEILMQAWGETADEMVAVGRQLASLDPRINVKVPITKEGVEVRGPSTTHSCGELAPFAVVPPTRLPPPGSRVSPEFLSLQPRVDVVDGYWVHRRGRLF
jgi:hypothetical protein